MNVGHRGGAGRRAISAPESIALPDPPLVDPVVGIVLRPWATTRADVAALVAAWTDPAVAAANRVPDDVSAGAAARWTCDEPRRRAAGLSIDLVIGPVESTSPQVLGEVGLRTIDRVRRRAEISWWIGAAHRRRGLATAAVRLLAGWALSPQGDLDHVWARIDASNTVSARVAAAADLVELGVAGGTVVWARSRPVSPAPSPGRRPSR